MDGQGPRRLSVDEAKELLRRRSQLRASAADGPETTEPEPVADSADRFDSGGTGGASTATPTGTQLATRGVALVQLLAVEARRRPLRTAAVAVAVGTALVISPPLRRAALTLLRRAVAPGR